METFYSTYRWVEEARAGFGPVVLTCALNGGVQGKESNAAIPETPREIARQAREAYDAGASIVHIHGRGPENLAEVTSSPEVYREINALVREACPEIIINNTTGGGPGMTMEARYACLAEAPEIASLNMGPEMSRFRIGERPAELGSPHPEIIEDACIPFTYAIIRRLAQLMLEHDVRPEMEMYHPGQFWVVRDLLEANLLRPPYLHQFVMGYQTSSYPTPEQLCTLVRELPADSVYFVCGIGPYQLPMTTMAILLGGHARVGLEDNVYYSRGRKLRGNGEAVERAVRIARELNREVATPAQARELLGLSAAPRAYHAAAPAGT